jgi:hypothetical protein
VKVVADADYGKILGVPILDPQVSGTGDQSLIAARQSMSCQ